MPRRTQLGVDDTGALANLPLLMEDLVLVREDGYVLGLVESCDDEGRACDIITLEVLGWELRQPAVSAPHEACSDLECND